MSAMFVMGFIVLVFANIIIYCYSAVKAEVPFTRLREQRWGRSR